MKEQKKENETKRELFQRIAPKRVIKVLKSLEVLGNCSNPYAYEFTDKDISKIFRELNKKLRETKSMFESKLDTNKFKLDD
tara:strand:- start:41 stop:283 length:243 start_codon:yes stop_codon:yes gene_type:complete